MKPVMELFEQQYNQMDPEKIVNRHIITSMQGARVDTMEKKGIINMCANNYFGLGADAGMIEAAIQGCREWGYGVAAGRNLCGTQAIHIELEKSSVNLHIWRIPSCSCPRLTRMSGFSAHCWVRRMPLSAMN